MRTFASSKTTKMNYRKEHFIYTLMWILIYISPVMGTYMRMSSNPHIEFSWYEVLNAWKFDTVWLVMFAVHNFLLAPLLILKRRTILYVILIFTLIGVTMGILWFLRPAYHHHRQPRYSRHEMVQHRDNITDFRPDDTPEDIFENTAKEPAKELQVARRYSYMRPYEPFPLFGPGELVAAFGGLLLMGMNLGVKLYFKSQEDSKLLSQIDKHNLERQLEYLKYQVNPHFFMNTLNNIHALVDIDPERAKTTIVELSKMMRYILYEGSNRMIPLPREVQFLSNYVQLMRLRYTDKVSIRMSAPSNLPDVMIPPLLLIMFVENAFKHGISYRKESFVYITVDVKDDHLKFVCRNSKQHLTVKEKKGGGMGLVNVRRRLDLLFQNTYTLKIEDRENEYDVSLDLPLTAPTSQANG